MMTATASSVRTAKRASLAPPPELVSEPVSQHQHLARRGSGWGGWEICFCSQPYPSSTLLSEKPLFLTEPWFPICSTRS